MDKHRTDKFFIAIAEEHIKAGMLDEAISVLKEGLQTYPNYLGARVSLGKAYLEKGMVHEAMREFEHVVQVSPDNLLAHRKLVSIYKDIGRFDDAIKACEILLVFNPKDKEIADLLSNLMREKMEKVSQHERTTGEDSITSSPPQEAGTIDFTSSWEIADLKGREKVHDKVIEEFVTETMGDIYITQGDIKKGIDIYMRIIEKEPENESVKKKLFDLTDKKKLHIDRLQGFLDKVQKNKRGAWKGY